MKLFLEKESIAEEVKKVFTTYYPYLRLELYKKPANKNYASTKKELLPLNKFTHLSDRIVIDISNDVTVAGLENQFENINLIAEVFRKSGNVSVETSLTSNWTLQQQNAEGEEISRHFSIKKADSSNNNQ
jgi:hypothetical protein